MITVPGTPAPSLSGVSPASDGPAPSPENLLMAAATMHSLGRLPDAKPPKAPHGRQRS